MHARLVINSFRLAKRWGFALPAAIVIVLLATALFDSQHNYLHSPGTSAVQIVRQTSLLGIFSLGAAVVIIAGGIDLSAGSVICFSGTVCGMFLLLLAPEQMRSGETPLDLWIIAAAIMGTLIVGLLIGSLHAWLITVINLPPFVATLATLVGLRSFARALCETVTGATLGGRTTQIQIFDARFRYLATSVWIPAVVFLVMAFCCWILLSKTVVGRHLYALGGNEQAARLSGIRTDRIKWLAYCLSAVLSSIAGILYICEVSVAEPQTLGRGYELNAIAAAVVGGASLQGGVGTVPGTVLGALFLRIVIDGVAKVIKTGADVYEGLIVGVVVVFAVAFSQLDTGRQRTRFFDGALGLVAAINLALIAGAMGVLVGPTLLAGWTDLEGKFLGCWAAASVVALLLIVRSPLVGSRRQSAFGLLAVLVVGSFFGLDSGVPHYRMHAARVAVTAAGGRWESAGEAGLHADLSGTSLDDAALKRIVDRLRVLPQLTKLSLARTQISDQGLTTLKLLPQLEQLDIGGTGVSAVGKRNLERALPDLEIVE